MAAGAVFFRERLSRLSIIAISLAALGVAVQALALGRVPWVSLCVALPFAGYGVVRKRVAVDARAGLFVECLIMLAPALALLAWLHASGHGHFLKTASASWWLMASGPITATPLALFAWATRRLTLTAMGFLQFLSPTVSFAVGMFQREAFDPLTAVAFGFIWIGLALFVLGEFRVARTTRAAELIERSN
jgi:chloramphenicol-sensitive protein RarD